MNRFFLTGILILGCVCFTVGKSYACPIVEIETDPQECGQKVLDDEACVGQWVHFDGSGSSDDGSIEDYVWDFPADACDFEGIPSDDCNFCDSGSNCLDGNDCNVVKCYFDEPGEHEVWLSVKDDEGNWRSDFAPVYVVDVNDVTGDVNYACVGCNVTFTVVTDGPPNHYDPIVWSSSPPASPNSTQKGGATFTGYWSTPGPKTVTAKCCSAGSASDSVTIVEVDKVKAGTKETGETLYLANDYLDEPNDRTAINQSVEAILSPSNVAPDECFFWSPGCGSLPKICPAGQKTATFTEKDHGNYTVTATCGSSNKTMYIAIEGINIKTENISEANEMTETYNIFLNENFDQENDQNDLPGHEGCCSVDYEDPWIDWIYGDNSDEIGTIILETETYGDTNAQVKFTASPQKIYLHASDYENLWLDTYYAVSSLPSSLRVEGIDAGEMTLKATIKTQDGYTAEDNLKIKVIRLNLMALDPVPSSDQHEICHKGKLIIGVNNNDSDGDGVMDLSDSCISGGDPDLAKIKLEKPAGVVASDISGNITVTFPANMNAFLNQDKTGGPAPASYSFSALPVDIYLEGVTASSDILDSKVKAEMTLNSGVKCHDEIWYTVIEVDITHVKFNHSAGDSADGIDIRENYSTDISVPEWVNGGQNKPAAYKKETNVTIQARFTVSPSTVASAKIRAITSDPILGWLGEQTVSFSGGVSSPEYISFTPTYCTPLGVNKGTVTWDWKVCDTDGGGSPEWDIGSSGPHTIYTVVDTPTAPMAEPWQDVLDIACEEASGTPTAGSAMWYIWDDFYNDAGGVYDTNVGAPQYAWKSPTGKFYLTLWLSNYPSIGVVNCHDMAQAEVAFANSLGSGAACSYVDDFGYLNCIHAIGCGWTNNPFYDNDDYDNNAVLDGDAANDWIDDNHAGRSLFGNHGFARLGQDIYDASGGEVDIGSPPWDANDSCDPNRPDYGPPFNAHALDGNDTWGSSYRDRVIDDFPVPPLGTGAPVNYDFDVE